MGKKAKEHRKKVEARNQKIKSKQNAFVKQFKERMDAGVQEELKKQADALKKEKEIDGTEERTIIDTTMSTPPTK